MKIALVVHDLHEQGGHSLYTKVLADQLSRRHEVLVCANYCERPANALWRFHPVRAWRVNALATVQTFPLGLRALATTLAGYDIRHMQGYCGGQPNVITAHICVAAYLQSLHGLSLRSRCSIELMARAEARFYRRYEGHIIAVSQKVADELLAYYQVRGPISVIPHGVDTSRFNSMGRTQDRQCVRADLGVRDDQILALYVGDLTKAHQHLKALTLAAPTVQLAIVTRSQQYRWAAPNIHFVAPTPAIERYYAAADAFVFPTTYDAFGIVLLEAMAAGLPIFSSDCAGAGELIQSGRDGFVFNLNEWVAATAARLGNAALLQSIGQQAEQTAQGHGWPAVVSAVEQIYFEVAGGSAQS